MRSLIDTHSGFWREAYARVYGDLQYVCDSLRAIGVVVQPPDTEDVILELVRELRPLVPICAAPDGAAGVVEALGRLDIDAGPVEAEDDCGGHCSDDRMHDSSDDSSRSGFGLEWRERFRLRATLTEAQEARLAVESARLYAAAERQVDACRSRPDELVDRADDLCRELVLAAALTPHCAAPYYLLGFLCYALGAVPAAAILLDTAAAADPADPDVARLRAHIGAPSDADPAPRWPPCALLRASSLSPAATEVLTELVERFDADQDGALSRAEFGAYLYATNGTPLSVQQWHSIVHAVGADPHRGLLLPHFLSMYLLQTMADPAETVRSRCAPQRCRVRCSSIVLCGPHAGSDALPRPASSGVISPGTATTSCYCASSRSVASPGITRSDGPTHGDVDGRDAIGHAIRHGIVRDRSMLVHRQRGSPLRLLIAAVLVAPPRWIHVGRACGLLGSPSRRPSAVRGVASRPNVTAICHGNDIRCARRRA